MHEIDPDPALLLLVRQDIAVFAQAFWAKQCLRVMHPEPYRIPLPVSFHKTRREHTLGASQLSSPMAVPYNGTATHFKVLSFTDARRGI